MANQEPKQIKCYCGHTTMCDCGEEPKQQTKMTYKDYIDLGFTRTEMDCGVLFNKTGYGGFALTKHVYENISIEVCNDELDSPKLYIRKADGDSYHIFKITPEAVKDLLKNNPR
jgi:hypothetical protein